MTRGFSAGGTDYRHQSLDDIIKDLKDESLSSKNDIVLINALIAKLSNSGYWKLVPISIRGSISTCMKHVENSIKEMQEIANEINLNVQEHHCRRLKHIGQHADELNTQIVRIWNQNLTSKFEDYDDPNFKETQQIYYDIRNCLGNLWDVDNMGSRLKDFIGRDMNRPKNNPWKSGSFYLFVFVVVLSGFLFVAKIVNPYLVGVIFLAALIGVVIIGAFQAKNDGVIKEESFMKLMELSFRRMLLLKDKTTTDKN